MRRDSRAAQRGQRGHTLVELIMVMVVIAVLAAVAAPRLMDRTALQERGFLDQIRSMLVHGRHVALAQRRDTCVLLAPAQVSVVYANAAGCNAAAPVAAPGSTDPLGAAVPNGVVLTGVAQVRFNTTGQPTPNVDHVLRVGGNTLTVSHETGIVF